MIPLPEPAGQTDRERGYPMRQYTAQQMREYAEQCVADATGLSVTHVDAARAVLVHLGYAISPSREPGADDRVDRVAGVLARCLQPNVRAEPPQGAEKEQR
jgi:hypothetical protein